MTDTKTSALKIQRLRELGYLSAAESRTGDISPGLARFQSKMGLTPDGRLDLETANLLSLPRCGMPDISPDPIGHIETGPWKKTSLTYHAGTLSRQLDSRDCWGAVRAAFLTWEGAGLGLTFHEITDPVAADISVEWRPAADPDRPLTGPQVAHADLPPGYSIVTDGTPPLPIHFDDEEHRWRIGAEEGAYDIESVALHEIGHILGLLHSDDPTTVMYPVPLRGRVRRQLTAKDLSAARHLYVSNG